MGLNKRFDNDGILIRNKNLIDKVFLHKGKWFRVACSKVKKGNEYFHCVGLYHTDSITMTEDEIL